jgi:hypothetical protein
VISAFVVGLTASRYLVALVADSASVITSSVVATGWLIGLLCEVGDVRLTASVEEAASPPVRGSGFVLSASLLPAAVAVSVETKAEDALCLSDLPSE